MLHDAMRQLTEDAAELLEHRLRDGEEIPFEVGEAGPADRRSTALFAYRPMTAEFVSSHADQLRALTSFEAAANNLVRTRGMVAYLRVRGEPVLDVGELTHARLAALAFLSAVWNDAEHFNPWDERFEASYTELESVALAERLVTSVFIPVYGVVLECEPVNLGAGVELLAAEDLDAECVDRFSDAVTGADCYCSISVDAPSDAPAPMAAVRGQARNLLTALRMFKPGSVSLGLTAQANVGGAWQQASLPFSGRSREEAWRLHEGEDDELRQFMGAVRRVERRTRVSWALKRFEMGLERTVPAEGLSDFLFALRALLEVHDDTGKAALPARVSALCARSSERVHVRESVEAAFALERLAVDGHVGRADRKRLAKQAPLEVIAETERYLRALLHDLVCGYLATDLKKLADEILLADGEPPAPDHAPQDPVYLEPVPAPGAAVEDPTATREYEVVFDDTAEINVADLRAELGEQLTADPSIDAFEPEQAENIDNVWTLRPAAEVRPAPELTVDGVGEGAGETAEDEPAPELGDDRDDASDGGTADVHQLAEDLVSRFESAFDDAMEDDAPVAPEIDSSANLPQEPVAPDPEPIVATEGISADEPPTPRVSDLFEPPPSFERADATERREQADRGEVTARRASPATPGTPNDAGFTFDFKVLENPGADTPPVLSRREPREQAPPSAADPDFPVPEFELPGVRGPAVAGSDDAVEAGAQRASFKEIMDENFTPPVRDLSERPSTPLSRDGRPHLVALDGAAAPSPAAPAAAPELPPAVSPAATAPAPAAPAPAPASAPAEPSAPEPPPAPEFRERPVNEFQPRVALPAAVIVEPASEAAPDVAPESETAPVPAHRPLSSESDRTYGIGPATIEFRPVVDGDVDDPDDFAGAC